MKPADTYFNAKEGPTKECLLFLRQYILNFDSALIEEMKYGMPFYLYNGKMSCYLWTDKKTGFPYMGVVEGSRVKHDSLVTGKRNRMKIFTINPNEDVDLKAVDAILSQVVALYKV